MNNNKITETKQNKGRANKNIPKRVNRLWGVTIFRRREEQADREKSRGRAEMNRSSITEGGFPQNGEVVMDHGSGRLIGGSEVLFKQKKQQKNMNNEVWWSRRGKKRDKKTGREGRKKKRDRESQDERETKSKWRKEGSKCRI